MLDKVRIRWALKFGKSEHFCGRLLGFLLGIKLLVLTFFLVKFPTNSVIQRLWIIDGTIFVIWAIYLLSHKVEKFLYPRNFRF